MATTPTELAEIVQGFVDLAVTREELFYEWATGTANGGPEGDGVYPVKSWDSVVHMIPAVAKLEEMLGQMSGISQSAADALAAGTISVLVEDRIYSSRALLDADLAHDAGLYALVVGDETPENNDLYLKSGASGSGNWGEPLGLFAAASALAAAERVLAEAARDEAGVHAAAAAAAAALLGDVTETISSINLLNPATMIVEGKYVTTSNTIGTAAEWAYAKIPVTRAQAADIALRTNTTRRSGSTFLDASSNPISGQFQATAGGAGQSYTRAVHADAAYFALNIKSDVIARPTQIMVNAGTTALPYEAWHAPYSVVTEEASAPVAASAKADVDATLNPEWANLLDTGDFVGGVPEFRTAAAVVDVTAPALLRRGVSRAMRWGATNNFARYRGAASLGDKYYLGALVAASAAAGNLALPTKMVYQEKGATLVETLNRVKGQYDIDAKTRIWWESGQFNASDPNGDGMNALVGSSVAPAVPDTPLDAAEFTIFVSDTPIDPAKALRLINLRAKSRGEAKRWAQAVSTSGGTIDVPTATLSGVNGLVSIATTLDGKPVVRTVDPFPDGSGPLKTVFNFSSDTLDGVPLRVMTDDVAPVRLTPAGTVGGNHGSIVNRSIAMYADNGLRTERTGAIPYRDRLSFHESYEIDAGSGSVAAITNTYTFDRDGQCTTTQDFIALANITLVNLMFLQAIRGTADRYYIPWTLPVVHEGFNRNYALIDTSSTTGWTTDPTTGLFFTPDRCEADSPSPDRIVMLHPGGAGLAVGYAPELSAAPAVRGGNTSVKRLEIRGTGKFYPSAIDKGNLALAEGDAFSVVGYRNLIVPKAGRTAFYPVRTRSDDLLVMDWHDRSGDDVLVIPPDFIGRQFTIAQHRNAGVRSNVLTGNLRVSLSGAGDYSTLMLRVAK